jgi:tRNA A-37 threonylcarbamoyl transferase component Bud32
MPQLVRSWLQRLLPEWFLPASVILKERNPEKADSYENEIDTYQHLQSLQGTHIPRLFGEVAVSHPHAQRRYQMSKRPTPAILLENVEGVPLHHLPTEELGNPRLLEELQGIYNLLTEKGVVHGDPRLHNFLRVDKRIVAIDFEFSYPLPNDITNEDELQTLKSEIEKRVRQAQGVDLVYPGSDLVFFINGSQVREGVRTDLHSSGTTNHDEQRDDEGPVCPAGSAA